MAPWPYSMQSKALCSLEANDEALRPSGRDALGQVYVRSCQDAKGG